MTRRLLFTIPFALFVNVLNGQITAQAPVTATGPAVLDDWGNRFTTLGASLPENAQRTQVRTAIAQLAMFDAVNAVLGGAYRPFASRPVSVPGASAEAAAIRAAYIVALNEFPTKTETIQSAYNASIAGLSASRVAISSGIVVGEAAAIAVLAARVGDHRNDPELEGYTAGSGPGVWTPTPPAFAAPQGPFLQFVTPFGYDDPARFRPKAPPALESRTYTIDYNEIRDLGRATETSRTPAQSGDCAVLVGLGDGAVDGQHPQSRQFDGPVDRCSFRGHRHRRGDQCRDRVLGCQVHLHVLASGDGHQCRR